MNVYKEDTRFRLAGDETTDCVCPVQHMARVVGCCERWRDSVATGATENEGFVAYVL